MHDASKRKVRPRVSVVNAAPNPKRGSPAVWSSGPSGWKWRRSRRVLIDATVYQAHGESGAVVSDMLLRVRLDLSIGPVQRRQVEPVHP